MNENNGLPESEQKTKVNIFKGRLGRTVFNTAEHISGNIVTAHSILSKTKLFSSFFDSLA